MRPRRTTFTPWPAPCPALGAAALAAALLLGAAAARAARPLSTDDAGVLDTAACEWESMAARIGARGTPAETAESSQLTCGVGHATQFALALGRLKDGEGLQADVGLAGKTLLAGGGDAPGPAALALSGGFDMIRLDGGALALRTAFVNGVASLDGPAGLAAHLNLGWLHDRPAGARRWTWNAALERALDDRLALMGEAYGDDRSPAWLAAGLRWTPLAHLDLNGSLGAQAGAERRRLLSVGAKWSF